MVVSNMGETHGNYMCKLDKEKGDRGGGTRVHKLTVFLLVLKSKVLSLLLVEDKYKCVGS